MFLKASRNVNRTSNNQRVWMHIVNASPPPFGMEARRYPGTEVEREGGTDQETERKKRERERERERDLQTMLTETQIIEELQSTLSMPRLRPPPFGTEARRCPGTYLERQG